MGRTEAAAGIVAVMAIFTVGWTVNGWRLNSELAGQRAEYIDQLRLTAEANAQTILEQQVALQSQARAAADLDVKHYEELSDALSKIRRLEALYSDADNERRRLRIDVIVARNDVIAIQDRRRRQRGRCSLPRTQWRSWTRYLGYPSRNDRGPEEARVSAGVGDGRES